MRSACQVCRAFSSSSGSNSPPGGDQWTAQPLSSPECPKHAAEGVTVVSHVGVEVPQQNHGFPGRGTIHHPRQGRQEGQVLHSTARLVSQNDSQRPVPNPKAQGCDPLIHWGKPQHEMAELGGNRQTHPSSPPLPVGHSRFFLSHQKLFAPRL
ncbi:hypothetical protein CRENBAI_024058 [Crenichthys baileyi]|uniref:Uncharacterized protein n=1 Tax=Crenichthys baileyi TaxID=28760 RepID=A0AAV9SD46_9TELE